MATGVPKETSRQRIGSFFRRHADNPGSPTRLDYAGKTDKGAVLSQSPSEVTRLWPTSDQQPANRLYFGDNLGILASLLRDRTVAGKVRLVYIDPPFATQTMFHSRKLEHAYEDTLCGQSSSFAASKTDSPARVISQRRLDIPSS